MTTAAAAPSRWSYARLAARASGPHALPRASPAVERAVVAQAVLGRDAGAAEDAFTAPVAETSETRAKFALLRRGVRAAKGADVVRDPWGPDAWKSAPADGAPAVDAAAFRAVKFSDDASHEAVASAKAALGKAKRVYLLDRVAVGVAADARVRVTAATDDARVARFLSTMLARTPRSFAQLKVPVEPGKPGAGIELIHSSVPDEAAASRGVKAYVGSFGARVTARGPIALAPLLSELAAASVRELDPKGAVVLAQCDVRRDPGSGAVTLVLGAPDPARSASAGSELQGALHAVWTPAGVSRAWDGILSAAGLAQPLPNPARTVLGHPKRVSFVLNPNSSSTKSRTLTIAEARGVLAEHVKFSGSGAKFTDAQLAAFEKLAASAELLAFE